VTERIRKIKDKIARYKRLRKKTDLLFAYFCLGKLLEDVNLNRLQKLEVKQQFTLYQYVSAIRIYRIFEARPDQIQRTKQCTIKDFHRLTSQQVTSLCDLDNLAFIGAENLEEEYCYTEI
jgi:hypothetical protein